MTNVNLTVTTDNETGWEVVDFKPAQVHEWTQVAVENNEAVLQEATYATFANDKHNLGAGLPNMSPEAMRELCRQQAEFSADRVKFAMQEAQKIVGKLPDEASRRVLQYAVKAQFSQLGMKQRLAGLENVRGLEPLLAEVIAKEISNLQYVNGLINPLRLAQVILPLAADFAMSPDEVEQLCRSDLDTVMGRVRDMLLVNSKRDPATGKLQPAVVQQGLQEFSTLAKDFVVSRQSLREEIEASNLSPEMKGAMRRVALAGSGLKRTGTEAFRKGAFELVKQLKALPPRVSNAVAAFCAGDLTVASIKTVLDSHFPGVQAKMSFDVKMLPNPVTAVKMVEFFKKASKEYNIAQMQQRIDEAGPDLSKALHLNARQKEAKDLTAEEWKLLDDEIADLKKGAGEFAKAQKAFLQNNANASQPLQQEIEKLRQDFVGAGQVSEEDLQAFQQAMDELRECEADFDKALEHETAKLADWTDEQKTLLKEGLKYLKRQVPGKRLFVPTDGLVTDMEKVISGQHGRVRLPNGPLAKQQLFMQLYALCGEMYAMDIAAKLPELSKAFADRQDDVAHVLDVIFGKDPLQVPLSDDLQELRLVISDRSSRRNEQLLRVNSPIFRKIWQDREAQVRQADAQRVQEKLAQGEAATPLTERQIQQRVRKELSTELSDLTSFYDAVQNGIKPEVAAQNFLVPKTYHLDSFVETPFVISSCCPTVQAAENQWRADFSRCGSVKATGDGKVTIHRDGQTVCVHNGTEGFDRPEEWNAFLAKEWTSKNQKVSDELKALCSSDEQYKTAMVAMTQSGLNYYVQALGASAQLSIAYEFSRLPDGSVQMVAKNGNDDDLKQVHATLIIHSDGTSKFTEFTLSTKFESINTSLQSHDGGWEYVKGLSEK